MRKLLFTALMMLGIFGALELATPPAHAINCSLVRCPGCEPGYVFKPTGSDCCRCVPA